MQDLIIALAFLALVASPAIAAALPLRRREVGPAGHANGVDFPASSLPASR